ncbi:RTPR, ribonucleoside-triphosphate reductase, adenosylcobalamin-dependent [uncultured Caudovirales phage]|uniref:RTPR, ribonucleoside-triphosphate reductase, adenosylcobalamin-dependent n=1 Tax=uncultured Caudovirales phage TaxID=2100421 RepID=A0A6J5KU69_9CAUD|nr:RTPR, ribonucleoside-triphosphate reductase, adenosylcobalamin-dependent [uncultured Caudovirales phage]
MSNPSARANIITRRTYNRPLNDEGTKFETWEQTVDRVIDHQKWLWERARKSPLGNEQISELESLRELMYERKVTTSGRTLWLGGTEVSKRREASQFNCSFARIETVHDVVDAFWLLLQGCGVGAEPITGALNGFSKPIKIQVIRGNRTTKGNPDNQASFHNGPDGDTFWHLVIGDSAEAWAKSVGKLLAMKAPVDRIVLDFSQIRPAGERLKGYGWISSGDETICNSFLGICEILNKRAGNLLTRMDILDVINWLGTTLSSRRAAEIVIMPSTDPEAHEFAMAKKEFWIENPQRAQSNNSLVFWTKPSRFELAGIFQMMMDAGGSEPGFINGEAARRRAPWFKGVNPCCEILLGSKSFCNLVEVDLGKFNADPFEAEDAVFYAARANYRQTCVSLDDGMLQRGWHELNEFLRLCGVGLTGLVSWEYLDACNLDNLRWSAINGADSMADELGLPRAKAVTTVKPSGTLSKIMDTTEGVHKPLGKYIFNNVNFSVHDPIVAKCKAAGYKAVPNPLDATSVLITFPVAYPNVGFTKTVVQRGGVDVEVEINTESAVVQLDRYKLLMDNYVDHNCSVTISYDPTEVPSIIEWLLKNWDTYVGVSFIYRNDPTKTAADLGYLYLPQEVVTKEDYNNYVASLSPVDLDGTESFDELSDADCATGACPIR